MSNTTVHCDSSMQRTCIRRAVRARATVLFLLGATCAITSLGCFGGVDQDDMRRHAIRRDRDTNRAPAVTRKKTPTRSDGHATVSKTPAQSPPSPPPPAKVLANSGAAATSTASASTALKRAPLPTTPLDLPARRLRSRDNLKKIGTAIKAYVTKNRRLPPVAVYDVRGHEMLSWRVALLPYLGYQELYDQFHLSEPWDSPHNKALSEYIPVTYQSPERFDDKTNYLVPTGNTTPFHGKIGTPLNRIEDGMSNTVAVVEVDDDLATVWTRPKEFAYSVQAVRDSLGSLRKDGFFVAWCDGTVSRVAKEAQARDLKAIFTYESGDSFQRALARAEIIAEPVAGDGAPPSNGAADGENAGDSRRLAKSDVRPPRSPATVVTVPRERRLPVPKADALREARQLAAEIFRKAYDTTRTASARQALARKILAEAAKSIDDPPSHYVLLEIAARIATESGDSNTALAATDQLIKRFDVDPLDVKYDVIVKLPRGGRHRKSSAALLTAARDLSRLAFDHDEFDKAEQLCQIALAEANRQNDTGAVRALHDEKDQIEAARTAHSKLRRLLDSGHDTAEPEVCRAAGTYYCLIKGDWERGLPLLAKSGDVELEEIAAQEKMQPAIAADQIELADRWWMLAGRTPNASHGARLRAAYWYEKASAQLPHGLLRIKAELRLSQLQTGR